MSGLAKFLGMVLAQVIIPLIEFYRGKITEEALKERLDSAIEGIKSGNTIQFEKSIGSSGAGKPSGTAGAKLRPHKKDKS